MARNEPLDRAKHLERLAMQIVLQFPDDADEAEWVEAYVHAKLAAWKTNAPAVPAYKETVVPLRPKLA
jgi:hypothetical protein